jgi:D-alanyl-D-alanine carboxypeptidase/D-alanyl-D-alanine-endopeptidase (penicillin-binding protein 4)
MVHLLKKIYLEVPQERLFAILPAGGQSGTLKNWYKSDKPQPYVYAKTGSLANVHCLSGYLVTKRGKTLIFSFMHNSIVRPINEVRREMEKVLKGLHERY